MKEVAQSNRIYSMYIPFSPPYIDQDIIDEVTQTLQSGWITSGPRAILLEEEIAVFCNVEKVLAVSSATSAMMLVLHWMGITRGDEVIIPAYTYCATALAVMHIGATPVMVDSGNDFNIDPSKIQQAITAKTKAIITVDFGGWPCNYAAINNVINSNEVKQLFKPANEKQEMLGRVLLLADAAHALGAVYNNMPVGTCADITVFSMHAVKNVTSAEGGLICLSMPLPFNNMEIYKTLKLWSMNGQTKDAFTKSKGGSWKYDIVYPGFKMNMPDVLAAIALAQLRKYKQTIQPERKRVVDFYNTAFKEYGWALCPPFEKEDCLPSYHLYPLRIKGLSENQRDAVIESIIANEVAVNVHFTPLPMLTVFKNAGYSMKDYPQAYLQYCNEISLPVYAQLSNEQCKIVTCAVIASVENFLSI